MREIRTEVQIAAPVEEVWRVLMDFGAWKDWNPTVARASGIAAAGEKLNITMLGDDCKEMTYQPEVMDIISPNKFRWRAKMMAGFIFTNDRVFELREKDGGTELIHSELYSGLMIALTWKKMQNFVPPILEKMNKALKENLEA